MSLERIRAHAHLSCLQRESLEQVEAWLRAYEEQGVLSFVLAVILYYHYEDLLRGRVQSIARCTAAQRLAWLRNTSDDEVAAAHAVPAWALETSRAYFKHYYAHLPQSHYSLSKEEEALFSRALKWLASNTRLQPLRLYECVAMPRESDDPLLHYPAQIPSKVLSVVSIDAETGRSQPPIIITPAGMSLDAGERVVTLVHEALHISQAHPPQMDNMHSNLIEGITDAFSLLACGRQRVFRDASKYAGDYEAELRFIVLVHLVAQAHRHQPLTQTLRDLHEELNVSDASPQYVTNVLSHYTHTDLNWVGLYVRSNTSPSATATTLYEEVMQQPAPTLRFTD